VLVIRLANTPLQLEAFFTAFATNGLAINLEKFVFATPSLDSWTQDFSYRIGPYGRSRRREQKLPTPSGPQATATFPWHGKLLPPFFAQVCTGFDTFNCSPEGGAKTLEWTVSVQEAFQNAKRLLVAAVPLQHSAPNAEFSLTTEPPILISEGSCKKN
jgi:hypothetical protein